MTDDDILRWIIDFGRDPVVVYSGDTKVDWVWKIDWITTRDDGYIVIEGADTIESVTIRLTQKAIDRLSPAPKA